jgi:hypothetical protein
MHFIDILDRYAAGPDDAMATDAAQYFEEVAQSAPREVVSDGIADAFRADQTPPFGDMVAQLFLHSDAQQRAGVLNQILAAVGPSTLANGPLGELFAYFRDGSRISDDEADAILPHQVREIAATAEKHSRRDRAGERVLRAASRAHAQPRERRARARASQHGEARAPLIPPRGVSARSGSEA